jgi:primosomal protein N'
MIAEVYPILKLPRRCSFFDYAIPDHLPIQVGDLVRINFKQREALGVVRKLKTHSEAKKLANIQSLSLATYLSEGDIQRFEVLAKNLVQSVSSVLFAALPTTPSSGSPTTVQTHESIRIGSHDVHTLEVCLKRIDSNVNVAVASDLEIAFALTYGLRRKMSGQMLLLAPRERDAVLLARYLNLGPRTALLHGHTPPLEKAKIIEAWRTGALDTLIGTRATSLLPSKHLTAVLVFESGNNEHLNARRNPRFDAREAAKLLAKQHQAKYIVFDPLPRLEDTTQAEFIQTLDQLPEYTLVNLGSSEEISPQTLLSATVLEAIDLALQQGKKTLLFLNRKGVAKRLQCGKCGLIPTCGTCGQVPTVRHDDLICAHCQTEMWIPTECPACRSKNLKLRGLGGAKITEALQSLFPTARISRLEKGHVGQPEADIVIATEYYFSSWREPFKNQQLGVIADLAADITLHTNDFRGSEVTARKLQRLLAFASRQKAPVYLQTWVPEILRNLLDLPQFLKDETALRQRYLLPPATSLLHLDNVLLENLPASVQALTQELTDTLQINLTQPQPQLLTDLKALPDSVKISLDGPYA